MSNSFAFGYLFAKLEDFNSNKNPTFYEFINYANNVDSPILDDFKIDEDMIGDILQIYSNYEIFTHNDDDHYIVGNINCNDNGDFTDIYGIVYLDYPNGKIILLSYTQQEEALNSYRPIYEKNKEYIMIKREL